MTKLGLEGFKIIKEHKYWAKKRKVSWGTGLNAIKICCTKLSKNEFSKVNDYGSKFCHKKKKSIGVIKMAQRVKVLAVKCDDLSLIPITNMMEGEY